MGKLKPLLEEFAATYGITGPETAARTRVPGVSIFSATETIPRRPLLYESGIIIIGQGYKIGYMGDASFRYDPETYLVVSVPVSIECEAHASPDEPLLGISIDVDPVALRDLISSIGDELSLEYSMPSGPAPRGVEPVRLDAKMVDATARLLECLKDPLESSALGKSIVDEILFRVLVGPHGRVLRMLTQQHTPYARVARSVSLINREYSKPLDVPTLARVAAMSTSAFHRAFKQVTGQSPLQYVKSVRLHRAHAMITQLGLKAGMAAAQVGYSSPSQFSREFKRYFDASPTEIRELGQLG